jgi:hypothetical protein
MCRMTLRRVVCVEDVWLGQGSKMGAAGMRVERYNIPHVTHAGCAVLLVM